MGMTTLPNGMIVIVNHTYKTEWTADEAARAAGFCDHFGAVIVDMMRGGKFRVATRLGYTYVATWSQATKLARTLAAREAVRS
jgi:hypothetical protein